MALVAFAEDDLIWPDDDYVWPDEDDDLKIIIYLDRTRDKKNELCVPRGTTIQHLKIRLSQIDPAAQLEATRIGLKLPGASEPLPDTVKLSADVSVLEVCALVAERPRLEHRKTIVLESAKDTLPLIDVATSIGTFAGLSVPKDCTISRFKQLLEKGELLGRKLLYANKLICYAMTSGAAGTELELSALLPQRPGAIAVSGPALLLNELEAALLYKLGRPDKSSPSKPVAVAPQGGMEALPLKSSGADGNLEFSFLGLTGQRSYMEDRACAVLRLPARKDGNDVHTALFGVFDGHGGSQVADLVARHMPDIVARELVRSSDAVAALEQSFSIAESELKEGLQRSPNAFDLIGTTAIVALVVSAGNGKGRQLVCANCGDSRAVLCRKGKAVDLSVDHKPTNPLEEQRIIDEGGCINRGRVQMNRGGEGGLNLSRSIGDFAYKSQGNCRSVGLIAQPEVKVFDIGPEDEFMALGSDGIFDAMSSTELVVHFQEAFRRGETLDRAVESAVNQALPAGDNATLCVVRFSHKTP